MLFWLRFCMTSELEWVDRSSKDRRERVFDNKTSTVWCYPCALEHGGTETNFWIFLQENLGRHRNMHSVHSVSFCTFVCQCFPWEGCWPSEMLLIGVKIITEVSLSSSFVSCVFWSKQNVKCSLIDTCTVTLRHFVFPPGLGMGTRSIWERRYARRC